MRRLVVVIPCIAVAFTALLYVLGSGVLGSRWDAGQVASADVPGEVVAQRAQRQSTATASSDAPRPTKQILFGDLHVHSTFSTDAFMMALPATGGDGARPVADACDFARFCSDLDFWSINDHALGLTPRAWQQTVESIRQCNQVAGDPADPDVVAFLGWEWTQFGSTPENHYGHKNVILRDLDASSTPSRPIAARAPADAWDRQTSNMPNTLVMGLLPLLKPSSSSLDFVRYIQDMTGVPSCPDGVAVRDLPDDCRESAATPAELFAKLDDWGFESMVIPHGTTWGFYTPQGSSWDKQLVGDQHDSERQRLIEVFSGHGNSEEFRPWQEIGVNRSGKRVCLQGDDNYLPSCWRAGELIHERCVAEGGAADDCEQRAAEARQLYVDADVFGHLTVPGARAEDWLDSGQCRDCFQPTFNYRPRSSVQYIMALRNFDDPQNPRSFDFGFIASSDNHTARPGTGYKEYARTQMTEARLTSAGSQMFGKVDKGEPASRSVPFDSSRYGVSFFDAREAERAASFFLTGGLAAVHSEGRSREQIWDAMRRREVYGTSGPRILLWFDLLPEKPGDAEVPMGGEAHRSSPPRFRIRAVGSLEQKPGCPAHSEAALSPSELQRLCGGECYNPGNQRRRISRIEVTRLAPQANGRDPIKNLIDDAWIVHECPMGDEGCSFEVEDPQFLDYRRDIVYYVRAIEEPSMAVNGDLLRCDYDAEGKCTAVHPCSSDDAADECLAQAEERAWSSPIFVRWREPAPEAVPPADADIVEPQQG